MGLCLAILENGQWNDDFLAEKGINGETTSFLCGIEPPTTLEP